MSAQVHEQEFVTGYIRAALWASCADTPDNRGANCPDNLDDWASPDDLTPDTRESMEREAKAFFAANYHLIGDTLAEQAGIDFWLTRNHHGSGYWDKPEVYGEETAKLLTDAADAAGERDLIVNDDWRIEQYPAG